MCIRDRVKISKNVERKFDPDTLLTGEVDLDIPELDAVVDIKNPYDTFTFSRNRDDVIDPMYWYQLQAYMHLWDRSTAYLIYFLNENMYMDDDSYYDKFNWADRLIIKKIERDETVIERYMERLPAIKVFFEEEKLRQKISIRKTEAHIQDMRAIINKSKAA